jgi:hypothetical protein
MELLASMLISTTTLDILSIWSEFSCVQKSVTNFWPHMHAWRVESIPMRSGLLTCFPPIGCSRCLSHALVTLPLDEAATECEIHDVAPYMMWNSTWHLYDVRILVDWNPLREMEWESMYGTMGDRSATSLNFPFKQRHDEPTVFH